MKNRAYDEIISEGGEGYTPYYQVVERPQLSREEEMDRILQICEGLSPQDPRYKELKREYVRLYEQEWDRETTLARRMSWNAEMLAAKRAGHKVNLPATEKKMGFTFADLKVAIAHHNL